VDNSNEASKPKKSLCGEMKKSPKFLDFGIIFEIHVLASILHNQVLQSKKFPCIVHVLFVIILTLHSHTSISHFCILCNLEFPAQKCRTEKKFPQEAIS